MSSLSVQVVLDLVVDAHNFLLFIQTLSIGGKYKKRKKAPPEEISEMDILKQKAAY